MPSLPKSPRIHAIPIDHQLNPLLGGDLVAIDGLVTAVPHREDDPPLGRAVDLHAEIAPVPAAGHVEGGHRFLDRGHLAIERRDGMGRGHVAEVHRGCVAALLEVEVGALDGGTVEHQGFELTRILPLRIERPEVEILIPGAFDREGAEVGRHRFRARSAADGHLAESPGHGQAQLGFTPLGQLQAKLRLERAGLIQRPPSSGWKTASRASRCKSSSRCWPS